MKLDKHLAGDYLSAADVVNGDKIKFLDTGFQSEIQGREVITFKVLTQKKEQKKISPNKTSLRTLAKKWTTDTDEWVGKIATIQKQTINFRGEMIEVIYLLPEGVTEIEKSDTAVNAEVNVELDEAVAGIEVEGEQPNDLSSIPF